MGSLKKTAVNSGKPSPYDDYFHPVLVLVLSPCFEIGDSFTPLTRAVDSDTDLRQ